MSWTTVRLKDLPIQIIDGDRSAKYPKVSEFVGEGVTFLNSKSISGDGLDFSEVNFITEEKFSSITKGRFRDGDILMTTRGSIGKVARVSRGLRGLINAQMLILRPDETRVNSHFLLAVMRSPDMQEKLKNFASGSAQPQIPIRDLREIETPLPGIEIQRRVASVLSTYDDLIENNTRRIAILEEMARRIYEEWFIRFRFPGHENVRMVESELGLVPGGWHVRLLGDEIELAYGKALKSEERKPGDVPVYGSSGIVGYHDSSLVNGPGIIVGRKGNVGSVHWSDVAFYPIDTVYYVRTGLPLHFTFFNLQRQNFLNNDAAVPGLNRNQAYALPLLLPNKELLATFESQCGTLLSLARLLARKNANLRTTRDLLLPKLISGELDVSAIPEPEAAAA